MYIYNIAALFLSLGVKLDPRYPEALAHSKVTVYPECSAISKGHFVPAGASQSKLGPRKQVPPRSVSGACCL